MCLAPLTAGTQTHSYLLLCHGFFSPCVVELKFSPLDLLKVRAPAQFMFKEPQSEKHRLTITATKAWPTGREALIELKLSFWIDHCVNFRINILLSLQSALQLRRAKIWNLSHGPFFCYFISLMAVYSFSVPCLSMILPWSILCLRHNIKDLAGRTLQYDTQGVLIFSCKWLTCTKLYQRWQVSYNHCRHLNVLFCNN